MLISPCPGLPGSRQEHLSLDEDGAAEKDVPAGGHLAAAGEKESSLSSPAPRKTRLRKIVSLTSRVCD